MERADKNTRVIEFRELHVNERFYGPTLKRVYHIRENGRSRVLDSFKGLTKDEKDQIIDLISKMATIPDFQSGKIRYLMKGYSYGELKPKGHRFFSFRKLIPTLSFLTTEARKPIHWVIPSIKN